MKKQEKIELIKNNLELKLVKDRLKMVCPMGDLKSLTAVELQRIVDMIEFERKWMNG